jgi:hypothetical protein
VEEEDDGRRRGGERRHQPVGETARDLSPPRRISFSFSFLLFPFFSVLASRLESREGEIGEGRRVYFGVGVRL